MSLKKTNAATEIKTEVVEQAVETETVTEVAVEEVVKSVEAETVVETVETVEAVDESADVLDDEPEAEVVTKSPEASTSTAVSAGNGNAVSTQVGGGNAIKDLATAGFDGLGLDFSSFVGIVLDKGEFVTTDGDVIEKEGFSVILQSSRAKFCFRSGHENDKDTEVAYSYDENADQDPSSDVAEKIAAWKAEDDVGYSKKKYLEVSAMVVDAGELDKLNGQLVLMSISPASIGGISGYLFQQKLKGNDPFEITTRVERGAKNTKGDFDYYPWAFKVEA